MLVVDILGSIDEKIETNISLCNKYENLMQLYFEQMLSFQNESWEEENLTTIAEYTNGLAMQKYRPKGERFLPVIKIKELSQGKTDANTEKADVSIDSKFIIDNGDIIFAWSGTLMVKIWCGGKGGLNQHLFKVTSNKYPKWFVYLWTKYHLEKFQNIAKGKAVTMGHIKREDLTKSLVYIPDEKLYGDYDAKISPLFDRIVSLNIENKNLQKLKEKYLQKFFG